MTKEALPTSSGTTIGCIVEQQNEDGIWKRINFPTTLPDLGVPNKGIARNIINHAEMYGEEQAMALAWWLLARDPYAIGKIRVVPYEINYSVECFRKEEDSKEIKL